MSGRPRKTLLELVESGGFRPSRHAHRLAEPLPSRAPADSPACRRIWRKLRALQDEYHARERSEVRREIADEFSRLVIEYSSARHRALPDPLDVIPGLRDATALVRSARRIYEAEEALGRELSEGERLGVLEDARAELRPRRARNVPS